MSRNNSTRRVGYISGIVKANNDVVSSSANVTQSMTFGKANRPSTPIQGVISNNYANIAAQEVTERYDLYLKANKDAKKAKRILPANTRAGTLAAKYHNDQRIKNENEEQRFKMKRFGNVGPRTSTNLKPTSYGTVQPTKAEPEAATE